MIRKKKLKMKYQIQHQHYVQPILHVNGKRTQQQKHVDLPQQIQQEGNVQVQKR